MKLAILLNESVKHFLPIATNPMQLPRKVYVIAAPARLDENFFEVYGLAEAARYIFAFRQPFEPVRKLHVGVRLGRTDTADPETRGCDVSSPTNLYKPVPLVQAAEWWQALAEGSAAATQGKLDRATSRSNGREHNEFV
jgi:hypothetical protein